MEKERPLVSIISVNFRQAEITADFLDSIQAISYQRVELILVDNGSLSDQVDFFTAHYPGLRVMVSQENLGFAGGNNLAIREATGDYILMINNDTLVPPGFLEPMVELMEERQDIGILSPKIYYADSPTVLQYAGINGISRFTGRGLNEAKLQVDDGSFDYTKPTHFAHGACMLVRATVFAAAGLMSERYFLYYEELDFCEAVRQKGWTIYYTGRSHIYHRESTSIGKFSPLKTYYLFRNRWLFMRTWHHGSSYYLFVLYFLGFGVPWHFLKHGLKGEVDHSRAIWRSVAWHLKGDKKYLDEKLA